MQHVAFRTRRQRVERPAGRQHQLGALGHGIDAGGIEADHAGGIGAIVEGPAVAPGDLDVVADPDVAQEAEMRIAMRRVDGDAGLAGLGAAFEMARAERERLAAGAGQRDGGDAEALHGDARYRDGAPNVGR